MILVYIYIYWNITIDFDSWEKLALRRIDCGHVGEDCTSSAREYIEHADLKRQIRQENTCNMDDRRCQTYGQILLSMAGYVSHRFFHEKPSLHTGFSSATNNAIGTMRYKVCKSVSGLKRHMVVHKHLILKTDPITLVGRASFLRYICFRLCEIFDWIGKSLEGIWAVGSDGEWNYERRQWSGRDYAVDIYVYESK